MYRKRGDKLKVIMFVLVLLALTATCWMIVRDTDREVDDAEQEEYLKRWMEITYERRI